MDATHTTWTESRIAKTFTLWTYVGHGYGIAGPHPHPKYLDDARMWTLASAIRRAGLVAR